MLGRWRAMRVVSRPMNQLAACAKPVSSAAAACPACGHPSEQTASAQASSRMMRQIVGALLVLAIAAGALYLGKWWIDRKSDDVVREQRRQ